MKVEVWEDRNIYCPKYFGTQNENDVFKLKIQVPPKYENFNKKIVFIVGEKIFWDIIQDNTYVITRAITQYKKAKFYIWLTKGEEDFRSKEKEIEFHNNTSANDEITQEEIDGVTKIVEIFEEEIEKAKKLQEDYTSLMSSIGEVQKEFEESVREQTEQYNNNAEEKLSDFNQNAEKNITELNQIADGVKDFAKQMQFATFHINENMELVMTTADNLGNINFSINERGELEVEIA